MGRATLHSECQNTSQEQFSFKNHDHQIDPSVYPWAITNDIGLRCGWFNDNWAHLIDDNWGHHDWAHTDSMTSELTELIYMVYPHIRLSNNSAIHNYIAKSWSLDSTTRMSRKDRTYKAVTYVHNSGKQCWCTKADCKLQAKSSTSHLWVKPVNYIRWFWLTIMHHTHYEFMLCQALCRGLLIHHHLKHIVTVARKKLRVLQSVARCKKQLWVLWWSTAQVTSLVSMFMQ